MQDLWNLLCKLAGPTNENFYFIITIQLTKHAVLNRDEIIYELTRGVHAAYKYIQFFAKKAQDPENRYFPPISTLFILASVAGLQAFLPYCSELVKNT